MFFKPKHLKQAKQLIKGVDKFVHYKKDILPEDTLAQIQLERANLQAMIKSKASVEEVDEQSKKLTLLCERAISVPHSAFRENLEVIFVALAIVVGFQSYFIKTFKIPTGSMQPTLNGIIAMPIENPEPVKRIPGISHLGNFLTGKSYIHFAADKTGRIVKSNQNTIFLFFTYTDFYYEDGHKQRIWAPTEKIADMALPGFPRYSRNRLQGLTPEARAKESNTYTYYQGEVKEGQVLAHGYLQTGDQVLVDKMSYHFRKPRRGEVFVFTTKDIKGIHLDIPQMGSIHYIKRLTGVPGDHLKIEDFQLSVNGSLATEPGIVRVMSQKDGYPGYHQAPGDPSNPGYQGIKEITLNDALGHREYFALGDNSPVSLDSRYWGVVPEQNLVGPALFVYWPLKPHFGKIK